MVCEVTESQAVFQKSLAPLVCLSQRNTLTLVMPFKTKMHATCPFVSPGTFSQTLYCINPEVSPIGCQIGHELNLNKTKCLVLPLNPVQSLQSQIWPTLAFLLSNPTTLALSLTPLFLSHTTHATDKEILPPPYKSIKKVSK